MFIKPQHHFLRNLILCRQLIFHFHVILKTP